MPQTLKQNRRPKIMASNRNGVQSLASLANAAQKQAVKRKNGKPITLGTSESNNTGNRATEVRTSRKPRKFVHVAPKATAQEILDDLGIKPRTVNKVRQIMRELGLNIGPTEE